MERTIDILFPKLKEFMAKGLCPTCGDKVDQNDFRDALSLQEFRNNGMCQRCQDYVFVMKEINK